MERIKEVKITKNSKVWKQEPYIFGKSGIRYSTKHYYVDDEGFVRFRGSRRSPKQLIVEIADIQKGGRKWTRLQQFL